MVTENFQEVFEEIKREVEQLPEWEQEYLGYDPETG